MRFCDVWCINISLDIWLDVAGFNNGRIWKEELGQVQGKMACIWACKWAAINNLQSVLFVQEEWDECDSLTT